jgi:hypothetical protein
MLPKELGRCNEFVEILKVFPHQCDICCLCVGCGVETFTTLCLTLWKFGMSWDFRISFCTMFKPMKTQIFLVPFHIDMVYDLYPHMWSKASIAITCFLSPCFWLDLPLLHLTLILLMILNFDPILSLLWHVLNVVLLHSNLNSFYFSIPCF